ncbi:hypothetical protein GE278_23880 (plasmid) [Enterobacteriaceae bacterium Kacie_13]|nr:hypothetical protein GE278_23880 [Enterobacteriaceae bacterium Kacie_13]
MNTRKVILCIASLIFCAAMGVAYWSNTDSKPQYIQAAIDTVSSRMSYNLGMSHCNVSQEQASEWKMVCIPVSGAAALVFSVLPSDKAPYDVPTPFYLVAKNAAAKKSSGEDLLSYMKINIGS